MPKTWFDQHLKTCVCPRCLDKPVFVPDKPVGPPTKKLEPLALPPFPSVTDDLYPLPKIPSSFPVAQASTAEVDSWINQHILTTEQAEKQAWSFLKAKPFKSELQGIWTNDSSADLTFKSLKEFVKKIEMGSLVSHHTYVRVPKPTVELLDSSNPFARVLDAWQAGKAGWTKGASFRRRSTGEATP